MMDMIRQPAVERPNFFVYTLLMQRTFKVERMEKR